MNARLLYLCFSCDFDFLSLITAHVEGQGVPADVDEVQGNVTGYDSDTPDSTNHEQAALAEDADESMPEDLTADQSEIMLHKRQKRDSNSVINCLRIEPEAKSRFKIPLCRLRTLPLVRPINEIDVQWLENDSSQAIVTATGCCMSPSTTIRRRHLTSRATSLILGAAFGSLPTTALRPTLWMILTLPDFSARCSICGRETIALRHGGIMSTTSTAMTRLVRGIFPQQVLEAISNLY